MSKIPKSDKQTLLLSCWATFPCRFPGRTMDSDSAIPSTTPNVKRRGCFTMASSGRGCSLALKCHCLRGPEAWVWGRCPSKPLPPTIWVDAVEGLVILSKSPVVNEGWDCKLAAAELGRITFFFVWILGRETGGPGGIVACRMETSRPFHKTLWLGPKESSVTLIDPTSPLTLPAPVPPGGHYWNWNIK